MGDNYFWNWRPYRGAGDIYYIDGQYGSFTRALNGNKEIAEIALNSLGNGQKKVSKKDEKK